MPHDDTVNVLQLVNHVSQLLNSITERTLREEHGLGVFENRVLRRIFGPKREEVSEG
jgi:hypothetical protein